MLEIRFFGVRGSIASPGPDTVEVGGNTSCVEVRAGGTRLVLDAGTGMRALGQAMLAEARGEGVEATLLLSHVHWDHIQGLPFFAPLYLPNSRLRVISGASGTPLAETLRRQMSAPVFPVDLRDVPAALSFQEVRDRQVLEIGEARVTAVRLNHPDAVHAYRIDHGGRSVVYATDTEHYSCVDRRLLSLARDADVLIYDAQYLPEEYAGERGPSRVGWGHSTYEAGVQLAKAADVGRLVLFHHDPTRTDEGVRAIEARASALLPGVVAAREGLVLSCGPGASAAA